ncbi:MAG: M28 family peptidase [Lachnospiraceae bacterium]|nr:M28 family peptidase [Lachnospiraceae bacterium]
MRRSDRIPVFAGLIVSMLAGGLLSGCAGPSTRVLPRADSAQAVYEVPEEIPVLEEANPFYLQESLDILAQTPRPGGSKGEGEAARYMEQLLTDYGYQVERQRFRVETETKVLTGTNVTAVRTSAREDADILIISTHHDTKADSPGANDSASGVAAWLETARLLSQLPSDTELRFVSFSGYEENGLGARYYMDSLTHRERERIIGAIDLGAVGYVSEARLVLGTQDGATTFLGDQLRAASRAVLGENWSYERTQDVDAGHFHASQIPAVSLAQAEHAFEAGTSLDLPDIVDVERVARATDVVSQAISEIMSLDTPSMIAKSRYYNDLREEAYVQPSDALLLFGETLDTVEARVGLRGMLDVSNEDAAGRRIEKYQFRMKWFDVDQIILSNYYFLDGKLDSITLEADGAGITFDEMKERLQNVYGAPKAENEGPNGTEYDWQDPIYHKSIALIPEHDTYALEFHPYTADRMVIEQRGADGRILNQNLPDPRTPVLLALLRNIFPAEAYEKIGAITFYSDGIGGTACYLAPMEAAEGAPESAPGGSQAVWELGIDVEDALKTDQKWRDRTGTIRDLTGLYGQLLAAAAPEQYRDAFEARFSVDGVEPEPGFEESFAMFALTAEPEELGNNMVNHIRYFYEFEELKLYRAWIQEKLQLHTGIAE